MFIREDDMGRQKIEEIETSFYQIYEFIRRQPTSKLSGLETTGGVLFSCQVKTTKDNRKFIELPYNNRIYENDWGYYFNDMGKDGQCIGQYSILINILKIKSELNSNYQSSRQR